MGVGHAAVALGASRFAPRMNVGWLVFAAFLADFLLGVFSFFGLEHATVPADFSTHHYLLFTFPYSHGFVPLLLWAAIAGFLISLPRGKTMKRVFWVVAAVVVSHFFLDGLVHVAGLPLAGENSPKLGLGLWRNLPVELALESLLTLAAIALYCKMAGSKAPAVSRYGVPAFMLLLAALTWTQLFAVAPPPLKVLPYNWLIAPVVFGAIAWLLDRKRVAAQSRTA
jgi:hypothetical protein